MSTGFRPERRRAASLAAALFVLAAAALATNYKQPGFSESAVFTGLTNPTVVRFLPDGRVLVAEKSGLLKVFPDLTTNSSTVVADLRTEVHNFWDRGLLGLAIDPDFATNHFVYVLYAYDAPIGGTPPTWGTAGATSDGCPTPPGATTDGCVISARLSRLTAVGSSWTSTETPLINDWCQQFPSHSIGSLDFGADGYLYVSGGDGGNFNNADWGQFGGTSGSPPPTVANPCGDPPFPAGTPQTKPTAEGGALRSQSPRRAPGEPRVLNGSILRLDPATGGAAPGNPMGSSGDLNEQRIIGYGFRNPFRMIVRPGTNEVWVADVGWNTWEELDKIPDLSSARNFGWPCFEGNATQYTGLTICPPQAQTTAPVLTYNHSASVVTGDGCTTGSSSVAGMAFYQGGSNYPSNYPNALFFSDYSRKCMWVMYADGSGNPDPTNVAAFANTAAGPVDLRIGPDGNLFYVDFDGGRVMEVRYGLSAIATASPTSGTAPLTVQFDGTGSLPAQPGDTLSYAWDLDGDGDFDDASGAQPSFTYAAPGTYTAKLKVTDQRGASSESAAISIEAGNTAPTAFVDTPAASLTWKVADVISFSGHATDPQDGTLPPASLSWKVIIHHCPSTCHTHLYQTFDGVAGGSFPAPDHEYPSYLEVQLTATDAQGLTGTASVDLYPQTTSLNFLTSPPGLSLTVGTSPPQTAPFTQTVIVGSVNAVQATSPQGAYPNVWDFVSWSDGGAQNHNITAPAEASSYTAAYATHADLSIAASAAPEPVGAGAALVDTFSVANAGPSQANNVSVAVTLPSGAAFVSAGGSGWSCSGSGPVTCGLASLGIGPAAPLVVNLTAPAEAGVITGSASVSSATADLVTVNNSASSTSTVFARADLSIGQSGAPAAICAGSAITYALAVSNAGPSTATSVSVSDALPAGAAFVSASGAGWICSGAATVTCTRPSLPTGAAPPITVSITAPTSAGTAVNAVSVSSAVNDPAAGNNTASASSTVNAVPTAPASGNNGPVCAGGTLQLTSATVAGGTYAWTGPNGFTSSLQNPSIANATPAASGVYSVTVTVNACTSPVSTTTAVVRTPPTAAASGGAQICAGASTPLSGSGGVSCSWAPATGLSDASSCSPIASPSATTTYTLTVTDASGCSSSDAPSVTVTVNPIPAAPAAGNSGPVCAGGTLALTASAVPGATYAWTGPNGFVSSLQNPTIPNATPAASGMYGVVATVNGCASPAATTAATVYPAPSAAVSGSAVICLGGSTVISAALEGTGPWSVSWSDGLAQSVGASPATRTVSPTETRTYTVTSVTDAHCTGAGTGEAVVTVGQPVDPPVVTAPPWVPIGASGVVASVPAHDGSAYAWTLTGGTLTGGQGSPAVTLTAGDPGTTMRLGVAETNTTCVSPVSTARIQVDFLDAPPAYLFHDFIDTIARNGVTVGCGLGDFCPDAPNTRAQMAVFLLKSKYGADHVPPPATGSVFLDVPASDPFAAWIEELASLQITGGCGGGNYCPGAPVTRSQMAVFLLKALEDATYVPPPATGTIFGDVPLGSFAAAWIEDLYGRGITGGCQSSPPLYCPAQPVTRGQMAVFLTKTFGLP